MQLNYEVSRTTAYIWDTDTTSLHYHDIMLIAVTAVLVILILLLLTAIVLKHSIKLDNWDGINLIILIGFITSTETTNHFKYIYTYMYHTPLYSDIRLYLGYTMLSITVVGGIFGVTASCFHSRKICKCQAIKLTVDFVLAYIYGTCSAVYIIPVLLEISIYPTEIISSLGFIVIGLISIPTIRRILKSYIKSRSTDEIAQTSKKIKRCYQLQMALVSFCAFIIFPIVVCFLLILYLSFLRILLESPTSQLTQIMLAFLPPICIGLGGYVIRKKLVRKSPTAKHTV